MIRTRGLVVWSLLLFLLVSGRIFAASRVECGNVKSAYVGHAVGYCALLPPSYDLPASASRIFPVLYMLHGLGQDSQSLINDGIWSLVEGLQDEGKISEFVIVTPNGDRSFY